MAEMSMVEKVARALTESQMITANELFKISDPRRVRIEEQIRASVEASWRMNEKDARAAIEAMREPTPKMVKAGVDFALQADVSGKDGWPNYIAAKHQLMIDAALSEEVAG